MKLYEISNPSDACTVVAEEDAVACVAVMLLGEGMYGLDLGGGKSMPVMILGADPDRWLQEECGRTIDDVLKRNLDEVIACLESLLYGTPAERFAFEESLEWIAEDQRAVAIAGWQDENRTSMNNIGRRAEQLAKALRRRKEQPDG
jgi:hypothetical protein